MFDNLSSLFRNSQKCDWLWLREKVIRCLDRVYNSHLVKSFVPRTAPLCTCNSQLLTQCVRCISPIIPCTSQAVIGSQNSIALTTVDVPWNCNFHSKWERIILILKFRSPFSWFLPFRHTERKNMDCSPGLSLGPFNKYFATKLVLVFVLF